MAGSSRTEDMARASALPASEDAAQHAAHDLPGDLSGRGAGGAFRHHFEEPFALASAWAGAAEEQIAEGAHEAAAGRRGLAGGSVAGERTRGAGGGRRGSGRARARGGPGLEDFGGALAVER